jgi:hypothetical protein
MPKAGPAQVLVGRQVCDSTSWWTRLEVNVAGPFALFWLFSVASRVYCGDFPARENLVTTLRDPPEQQRGDQKRGVEARNMFDHNPS